ncbi:acyl-coenzyme A oxidase 2, peroxisomal-like [Lathyrus oleraceus]|uniref:acyl-coenzyme A oxidase 2, peroxisomal-like n=1 Tax=Pisum sativum TaxID=3888 RepID=UPI0021D16A32|nr:acyl-coenzyme A oxidase 2, peroxisomal-like [Pisum sativum]
MNQLLGLVREAGIRPLNYVVNDPAKYFAILEAVGSVDMSLGIKMDVQFSLWGGSVINLGTQKHKDKYYDGIDSLEYAGCFAMTELHHDKTVYRVDCLSVYLMLECRMRNDHDYAVVNRFGSLRNDHDIFQTFEGDNTVLLQQVAGDLLKQYQKIFKGGTLAVTWNYLRDSMSSYLSQPNPVTARWESQDHLRNPKFQLDAFRYRKSRLLHSIAVRLQKHSKSLGDFGACNKCLNHLLTLAESYIESAILAKFIEAMQSCPDPSAQAALKLACDLYALDRIWNDIGTYRNVDYVAPKSQQSQC